MYCRFTILIILASFARNSHCFRFVNRQSLLLQPIVTHATTQAHDASNVDNKKKPRGTAILNKKNSPRSTSSESPVSSPMMEGLQSRPRKVHRNKYASLKDEHDMSDRAVTSSTLSSSSLSAATTTITATVTTTTTTTTTTAKKPNRTDPLLEALRKKEEDDRIAKQKELEILPIKGTTVPTLLGSLAASKSPSSSVSATSSIEYHAPENIIPSDPFTFGYVQVGACLGPHGVKGEIKVLMDSELGCSYLKNGQLLYIKMPNRRSPRAIRITSARKQVDTLWLLIIEGISSRLSAAALKSYTIFIKKCDRPQLGNDEYLVRDLVGLNCYLASTSSSPASSSDSPFAIVEGVVPAEDLGGSLSHLMHSMLELRLGGSNQLCLVPLVPQICTLVNVKANRIEIDPPIGLLDLTYEEVSRLDLIQYKRKNTHARNPSSCIMNPYKSLPHPFPPPKNRKKRLSSEAFCRLQHFMSPQSKGEI